MRVLSGRNYTCLRCRLLRSIWIHPLLLREVVEGTARRRRRSAKLASRAARARIMGMGMLLRSLRLLVELEDSIPHLRPLRLEGR